MKKGHVCQNRFVGGADRAGCYFEIEPSGIDGRALLNVGWSCVVVHNKEIPVSWLSELIAIATAHEGGLVGFLQEHRYGGGESFALQCDPAGEES